MTKKILLALIFNISLTASYQENLPEPYKSIKLLPFDGHGWFANENIHGLRKTLSQHKPLTIVEIGSWLGCSTRFIASLIDDNTTFYAVDNWNTTGSIGVQNDPATRKKLPTLFQQFLSNAIHTKLAHKMCTYKKKLR